MQYNHQSDALSSGVRNSGDIFSQGYSLQFFLAFCSDGVFGVGVFSWCGLGPVVWGLLGKNGLKLRAFLINQRLEAATIKPDSIPNM